MTPPAWIRAEPYECWFSLLGDRYRGDFGMVLEFDGRLDAVRLDRALRNAIAAEPIWGYRFVDRWWYPYWRPSNSVELRSLVSVRALNDVPGAIYDELTQPLEAAARMTILRQPAGDTLLLRIDHRRGDATSGHLLLAEIHRHYQLDTPEPAADFVGAVVHRTIRLLRDVTPVARQKQYPRELRQLQKSIANQCAFRVPPVTSANPYSSPRLLRYGPGSAEALSARALRERATAVMVLQAATYFALRDVVSLATDVPLPVVVNVDLRRYLPQTLHPVHAANLVGDVVVEIAPSETDDFSIVLDQIREQLRKQRGPEFGILRSNHTLDVSGAMRFLGWIPNGVMRRIVRRNFDRVPGTPRVVVTDQTALGGRDLTWGTAEVRDGFCMLGISHVSGVNLIVTTCGTNLTIAVGFGPVEFVRALAERIDVHLCRFMGWTAGTARREVIEPTT